MLSICLLQADRVFFYVNLQTLLQESEFVSTNCRTEQLFINIRPLDVSSPKDEFLVTCKRKSKSYWWHRESLTLDTFVTNTLKYSIFLNGSSMVCQCWESWNVFQIECERVTIQLRYFTLRIRYSVIFDQSRKKCSCLRTREIFGVI